MIRPTTVAAALALVAVLCAFGSAPGGASSSAPRSAVLVAAGDIASCRSDGDEKTARILARMRGTIATLGDNVYESGTLAEFQACFRPTWGRFKRRIRPAAGNHEWATPGAAGYFAYFGRAASPNGRGRPWYSYDLGTWHVVVLDSDCSKVGGCARGSPQERWLRRDLRTHRSRCTLAYWHHARFSSGLHGNDESVEPFWRALYAAGADIVLSAHDHHYERFAPQTPDGRLDRRRGIREFVVGTGGRCLYTVFSPIRNSRAHDDDTYGVLKLTLLAGGYRWRFVPVAGETFTDTGRGRCH